MTTLATLTKQLGEHNKLFEYSPDRAPTEEEALELVKAAGLPLAPGVTLAQLAGDPSKRDPGGLWAAIGSGLLYCRQARAERGRSQHRAEFCQALAERLDDLAGDLGMRPGPLAYLHSSKGKSGATLLQMPGLDGILEALAGHLAMPLMRPQEDPTAEDLKAREALALDRMERAYSAVPVLEALGRWESGRFLPAALQQLHDQETILHAFAGVQALGAIARSAALHWERLPRDPKSLPRPGDDAFLRQLVKLFTTAFGAQPEPGTMPVGKEARGPWQAFASHAATVANRVVPREDQFTISARTAYDFLRTHADSLGAASAG